MGITDKFNEYTEKAKDVLGDNADKVKDGVETAKEKADGATDGKYTDKMEKGAQAAKDGVDKLSNS